MQERRTLIGTASAVLAGLLAATACSSGGDGDDASITAMASQLERPAYDDDEGWLGGMYFNLERYTEGTGTEIEPGTSTGDVIDEIGIGEAEWSLGRPLIDAVTRMDVDGVESVPLGDVTATYFDFEGRSVIVGDFEATDIEGRLTSAGGGDAVEAGEEPEWTVARFPQPEDGDHVIGFGNEVNIAFSDGMAVTPAIDDGDGVSDVLVDDEDESLLGDPAAADVVSALDDVEAYSAYLFPGGDGYAEDDANLPAPWDFGGLASSVVDDERQVHVALGHSSEDDAAANAEPLGVVVDDWVECEGDVELETDGSVTVASCAAERHFVMEAASRLEHANRLTWPAS